ADSLHSAVIKSNPPGSLLISPTFHASMQRRGPAGNDSLHKVSRCTKRRRDFARIQNAHAAAGSGTDVKEAATISERFSNDFNCASKSRRGGAQWVLNEFFFLDEQLNQLLGAQFFEVFRAWVALFRQRRSQTVNFVLRWPQVKRGVIVRFCCEPRGAELRRSLGSCHASIGKIFL